MTDTGPANTGSAILSSASAILFSGWAAKSRLDRDINVTKAPKNSPTKNSRAKFWRVNGDT